MYKVFHLKTLSFIKVLKSLYFIFLTFLDFLGIKINITYPFLDTARLSLFETLSSLNYFPKNINKNNSLADKVKIDSDIQVVTDTTDGSSNGRGLPGSSNTTSFLEKMQQERRFQFNPMLAATKQKPVGSSLELKTSKSEAKVNNGKISPSSKPYECQYCHSRLYLNRSYTR